MHVTKSKKPVSKGYMYDLNSTTFWKKKNYRDSKKISASGGRKAWTGRAQRIFTV